jgi:hypothetical protein
MFAALAASALLGPEKGFSASEVGIERLDRAFDALIPADAKVEKLAEGFIWSEGPTWFQNSVVFSDVPDNVIYQWKPGDTVASVFMKPSGLLNPAPGFGQPGSNGLAVDIDGRLLICQQGERRVARLEKNGTQSLPRSLMASASTRQTISQSARTATYTLPIRPMASPISTIHRSRSCHITASIAWIRKAR